MLEGWSTDSCKNFFGKTINNDARALQNHKIKIKITSMSWHMSSRYGPGILVSGYPVLTAVNWPYSQCPILKMWTCQDTPETPSLPFDSLPYPTRTICRRVRMYVRTLGQSRENQTKRGWPYSMSMGLCPTRAKRAWAPHLYLWIISLVYIWTGY